MFYLLSRMLRPFLVCLLLICFAAPLAYAEENKTPVGEQEILSYLEQVISWQRAIIAFETMPDSSLQGLLKDNLDANATRVLQYGFDFAGAEANALGQKEGDDTQTKLKDAGAQNILKVAADVDAQILRVQKDLDDVATRLGKAHRKERQALLVRRVQLEGEMKLTRARQEVLKSVIGIFSTTSDENAETLTEKINNLSQTLPEMTDAKKKTAAAKPTKTVTTDAAAPAATETDEEPDGLFALSNKVITLYRKKREVFTLLQSTHQLQDTSQSLIHAQRDMMMATTGRGTELVNKFGTQADVALDDQRAALDALIGSYKELSTAILPVGQANLLLSAVVKNLEDFDVTVNQELTKTFRSILWRVGILGFIIFVLLGISELVHRATVKYVHDSRRQRQLRLTRRFIVGFIILLIIILNFADFGSFATYAGLLTAGLAVALQNIILSVVGYFFLFGRFGVRIGDRLTISGVTGEVIQVGLVRMYLMEMVDSDSGLHPTGKIVAFPNSVLFQPTAFSKHIPGASYNWQEITFILEPDTNYQMADKKLSESVNAAYKEYRDIMEKQQTALTQATHLDVKIPPPKGFLRFIDNGLAFVIRYPVDINHAAEINQRITKQILETINSEPSLKLVTSSPPKIEAVKEV